MIHTSHLMKIKSGTQLLQDDYLSTYALLSTKKLESLPNKSNSTQYSNPYNNYFFTTLTPQQHHLKGLATDKRRFQLLRIKYRFSTL